MTIVDHSNFNYQIRDKDEPELKKEKIHSVSKLVNLQLINLEKCISKMVEDNSFS